ncbi:MAG: DNA/RNA nuclease SfsA [Gammaproteobacteria bacterium]
MNYESALQRAVLVRRYKRFLADVTLPDGTTLTMHCPNTGSMLGCADPGSVIMYSRSNNPKRKYAHTFEQVISDDVRVGVHTGRANALVAEAIDSGVLRELAGYTQVQREVTVEKGSRLDFVLTACDRPRCCVEVKNVSAAVDNGVAFFPDAVSERARKHLEVLMRRVDEGERAVLVFCVQRDDVVSVRPADDIDPQYGRTLRRAIDHGVEVCAWAARLSDTAVELYRQVPVLTPPLAQEVAANVG